MNVVQSIVEVPLFCSPAIAWISRRVLEALEFCCDIGALVLIGISGVQVSAVSALRWSPQADDTVYTTSDAGVQPPVLIHEVKPQYTDAAKKRKVQGTVDREAVVTREGQVRDDIRVVKSLDPDLDAQAIKALQQWQFRPATKDGKPANITVQVETTFTLK